MNIIDLSGLTYEEPNDAIVKLGVLVESDGDELLSHYFSRQSFDNYIEKFLEEDDDGVKYYSLFRVGYVVFYYFYNNEWSMRDVFLKCKDYVVVRKSGADVRFSEINPFDLVELADEFGPLEDSFYGDGSIYTDYAREMSAKLLKKK